MSRIDENFTLNITKTRKVKTPEKAWDAAGWDFFIPENLSIFDFTKSYKAYLDDSVSYDKTKFYFIPLVFHLISERTVGEFKAQLVLKWNEKSQGWAFHVCDYENKNNSIFVGFDEIDNELMKWLTEDGTVISSIELLPHASINIPSGIRMNLPDNIFLIAANKSGIASKRRMVYLAQVIDPDYMGEVHLNMINLSDLTVTIKAGEKIIQMLPMFQPIMREVKVFDTVDELFEGKESERGEGRFRFVGNKVNI
jgi:dUTPase